LDSDRRFTVSLDQLVQVVGIEQEPASDPYARDTTVSAQAADVSLT
jgi:hypothetical protein